MRLYDDHVSNMKHTCIVVYKTQIKIYLERSICTCPWIGWWIWRMTSSASFSVGSTCSSVTTCATAAAAT